MRKKRELLRFINYRKYITAISVLALSAILLNIMYRVSVVFANSYSNTVYRYIVKTIGTVFSFSPISMFELFIIAGIILLLFSIGRLIYLLIRYHKKSNIFNFTYRLKKSFLNFVVIILSLFIIYTLNCGINYNRLSFSACNSMETKDRTKDELISLAKMLTEDANTYSSQIDTDTNGHFSLDNINLSKEAITAMEDLSQEYPCLSNYYTRPKPIFFSRLMSYTRIVGIYSPFTVEANYNNDVPDLEKPYTVCHELSHLSGFMLEDEANFISYLACMNSSYSEFKYSGTLSVLTTVFNKVYDVCGAEAYTELIDGLNNQVLNDLSYENKYWNSFESPAAKKVSAAADSFNDAYLKTNGLSDGVFSYGRVTDLLLTYYADKIETK